ncbi:hypothetical protein B0H19DRAFT_667908 [Mycena capillaripes]|nr:hypothetical protein B0H19DRAFT_667908 [Mycena capillaripes]
MSTEPWDVDYEEEQLLCDVPPESMQLSAGSIIKLPIFPNDDSVDAEMLSLKSFNTSGGGKQKPARAKPQPCIIIRIEHESLTNAEGVHDAFRLWLVGLYTFGGKTEDLDAIVKALDSEHSASQMGVFLYPITRISQEPRLPSHWTSLYGVRPHLVIQHASAFYEPPSHTWAYGDVVSFVAPADTLKIQLAKPVSGGTHVTVPNLVSFLRGVARHNPQLENREAIEFLDPEGGGYSGVGNNRGSWSGGKQAGGGVRIADAGGAGGPRPSIHLVDIDFDEAEWDAESTFTLPPPDSSSERQSDNGSTFSLPLDEYPPPEAGRHCSHYPFHISQSMIHPQILRTRHLQLT